MLLALHLFQLIGNTYILSIMTSAWYSCLNFESPKFHFPFGSSELLSSNFSNMATELFTFTLWFWIYTYRTIVLAFYANISQFLPFCCKRGSLSNPDSQDILMHNFSCWFNWATHKTTLSICNQNEFLQSITFSTSILLWPI